MKVLFVCNQNENRSKTAEMMFKGKYETDSAGLFNDSPVTVPQLEWADLIIVMENEQRTEIGRRFPKQYLEKKIMSLGIPDIYSFGQAELKEILKEKMSNV